MNHHGWQKVASTRVNTHHREEVVWPLLSPSKQASVRSQSGPMALIHSRSGCCCCAASVCRWPLSSRFCSCGRSLDVFGHHKAACGKVGGCSAQGNSDSRRLEVPLWRSATGSGRDIGVCAPWRWNAGEESRLNQWSGSEARSEAEGGQVP